MIFSIYNNALILVVLGSMVSVEELVLGLNDLLYSLMGRRSLNLTENISQKERHRFFLMGLKQRFMKDSLETNGRICIQVSEFLDVKFFNGPEAIKLFLVIN